MQYQISLQKGKRYVRVIVDAEDEEHAKMGAVPRAIKLKVIKKENADGWEVISCKED